MGNTLNTKHYVVCSTVEIPTWRDIIWNHQLFFIIVIEMIKKFLVTLFMMMFMCSVAVDFGATMSISDCGSNTTILHFTDYHATEVKRNKVLSFWSGDALLKENITAGKTTLEAYRNDVGS